MIVIGWKTNDYRGPKAWAALWSYENTPSMMARAIAHAGTLDHAIVREHGDDYSLAKAKADLIDILNS